MGIKIKKVDSLATFHKAHANDVGFDLTCCGVSYKKDSWLCRLHLGVKVEPPPGYWFMLVPRSSFPQSGWMMANSVGIVDPAYRGEWLMQIVPWAARDGAELSVSIYPSEFIGQRVAQAILTPYTNLFDVEFVDLLSETARGEGGFGSTGKQ